MLCWGSFALNLKSRGDFLSIHHDSRDLRDKGFVSIKIPPIKIEAKIYRNLISRVNYQTSNFQSLGGFWLKNSCLNSTISPIISEPHKYQILIRQTSLIKIEFPTINRICTVAIQKLFAYRATMEKEF